MKERFTPPPKVELPRVLGLYEEVFAMDCPVGWRPVAWAVELPDGQVVTASVEGPVSATLWRSLEDAATAMDVCVDEVGPRVPRRAGDDEEAAG